MSLPGAQSAPPADRARRPGSAEAGRGGRVEGSVRSVGNIGRRLRSEATRKHIMKSAGNEHHLVLTQFANLMRSFVLHVFGHDDFPFVVSCFFARVKNGDGAGASAPVPLRSVR